MLFKIITFGFVLAIITTASIAQENRFDALRQVVFETPYDKLPQYEVSKKLFGRGTVPGDGSNLAADAKRTLSDPRDLLADTRAQKLLQANGICFTGEWRIDQDSPFSGLFRQHTRVPVIARASTTFSGTRQNERRALGLAVKLLPPDLGPNPSLNVFALHSAGGVTQKYMLDLAMDNEPPLGRIPRLRDISTALALKNTLLEADRESGSLDPSVTYRSVEPLASYAEPEAGRVIAPRWLRFSPLTEERIDHDDFRDELRVENYSSKQLVYAIEVADHESGKKSNAVWQSIGQLVFKESVTSAACDKRLHFAHTTN